MADDAHDKTDPATTPSGTSVHNQTIDGNAQIGVAVAGDVGTVNYHAAPNPVVAPRQLRAPTTEFVGRTKEISELVAALGIASTSGSVAAISGVRGMGGIGKSELAYVVAAELSEAFDYQIELDMRGSESDAALSSVQALQQVIAAFDREIKLPEDERELIALYRSILNGKRVLVFADDAKDPAQVRPLMPPPGSALLVTSRQRFRLPGMVDVDLDRLSPEEANELLLKTCSRLTVEQAVQISALCENMPLALVISAGILDSDDTINVARYTADLRDERQRLALLIDPDDPKLDVEASLNLSYKLLDAAAKHALAQLGVFTGSFAADAAQATLNLAENTSPDVALGLLRRRSLLEFDSKQERYSLHELVRVFALARLREQNAEEAPRLRHARYYIHIADQADQQFRSGGKGITTGLALFDRERGQLDAGRAWLQQHAVSPETDDLLILDADVTALIGDLRYAKRTERIPQLEAALKAAQRRTDRGAQGSVLGNLGLACADLGEVRRAIGLYEQQLTIVREMGDRQGEGRTLGNLGIAYYHLGEVRRAIGLYEQHLTVAREIGDRQGEGSALGNLGSAYYHLGKVRRAIGLYEQQLTIAREMGDRQGEGRTLGNLGVAYANLGEVRRAIGLYEQQLTIAREIGDRQGEADASWNYGQVLIGQGEIAQGLLLLDAAQASFASIDHSQAIAMAATIAHVRQHGTLPLPSPNSGVLDGLPEAVRIALQQQDNAAFQKALAELPPEEAAAIVTQLEEKSIIGTRGGPALTRTLREFEPLLRSIAVVAHGDQQAQPEIEALLPQLEEHNWQLSDAVRRIWAGERDVTRLTENIDANSAQLVQRVIDLLNLPENEELAIVAPLDAPQELAAAPDGPDMVQIIQAFLPTLGDIALGAHGDPVARTLAEAALPQLEANRWRLTEAVQRIWTGERDEAALTANIDPRSAQVVRRILALVADGPSMIFAASSLQLGFIRQQAEAATAQALDAADAEQRATIAAVLDQQAQQIEEQVGDIAPWPALAADLRVMAVRLRAVE